MKEGTWSFEWKLDGSSSSKMKKVKAALGDTGAVVLECEVSPISLRAVIDTSNMKTEDIFSTNRIIDVEKVASFLFVKSSWGEGEKCSEDNFYEVSIVD